MQSFRKPDSSNNAMRQMRNPLHGHMQGERSRILSPSFPVPTAESSRSRAADEGLRVERSATGNHSNIQRPTVGFRRVPCTYIILTRHAKTVPCMCGFHIMFLKSSQPLGAKQVWKTTAPPRVTFFWWLVIHGRCWTDDWRFRHGLQDSNTCVICD
jgi:hypothetical protein